MKFTYEAYFDMIDLLRKNGYSITDYFETVNTHKCAVLRHDVDYSLSKAVRMGEMENERGVRSTYFVLLTSDLYNIASKKSQTELKRLISLGHDIGLHFDEGAYENLNIVPLIKKEAERLSEICEKKIRVVSMHRPSQKTINSFYEIPGMVNVYGEKFFKEYKYISDSRMYWRESIEEIIKSQKYSKLQILTHGFWYGEEERTMREVILEFFNCAESERYEILYDNFSCLEEVVRRSDIEK